VGHTMAFVIVMWQSSNHKVKHLRGEIWGTLHIAHCTLHIAHCTLNIEHRPDKKKSEGRVCGITMSCGMFVLVWVWVSESESESEFQGRTGRAHL
jgi:hypothetical protein